MDDDMASMSSRTGTTAAGSTAGLGNNFIAGKHSAALAVLTLIDMDGLSYEEYFKKVDEMINSLRQYWRLEQRVKALKVAIQLTKLLADTSQIKLYSKKYKMITDILDEFGRLICLRIKSIATSDELMTLNVEQNERLSSKQQQQQTRLFEQNYKQDYNYNSPAATSACLNETNSHNNLLSDSNLDKAKDTCRNWFLKIASIRELVPRFYTELAILKVCDILLKKNNHNQANSSNYSLTEEQFYSQSLKRLTKAAWGFGDPIVAVYARAYLCKVGQRLINWDESEKNASTLFEIIMLNLEASAKLISNTSSYTLMKVLKQQKLESIIYFELISNALQAIINLVTLHPNVYNESDDKLSEEFRIKLEKIFNSLMRQARQEECSNFAKNILLHATLKSLPGDIIATNAKEILETILKTHKIWKESTSSSSSSLAAVPLSRNHSFNGFGFNENNVHENNNNNNNNYENNHSQQLTMTLNDTQMISSSLYSTISSFAFALDSSDLFETNCNYDFKNSLLISIDLILEDLFNYEVVVENNPISLNYLRSYKAWFSYANHYLIDNNGTNNNNISINSIVDDLLNKFVIRIKRDRQYVNHHSIILDIIKILFSNRKSLQECKQVFLLKSYPPLISLLSKDDHKLEASRWILETIRANIKLNKSHSNNNNNVDIISDKTLINSILKLATIINDSLNLLTPNDDIEHLSQLIIFFLEKITVQDYREHLDLFSRCRGSLGNLNPIVEYLARRILKLGSEFKLIEKRRNVRRNFLNACLAFTFITIPAISSSLTRLNLYIDGTRLALDQMSLSFADFYLKQVLSNLNDQLNKPLNQKSIATIGTSTSASAGSGAIAEGTFETIQQHSQLLLLTNQNENVDNNNKIINSTNIEPFDSKSAKANTKISKSLLDQVNDLLALMLSYGDHIDLKHKLTLANLILSTRLNEHSNVLKMLNDLNINFDDVN